MRGIARTVSGAALWLAGALQGAAAQHVDPTIATVAPVGWAAPFGGSFSANFTVTSDYSYGGISNSQLGPAFQAGLDYRSPNLVKGVPVWFYLGTWGTNVSFPSSGPGMELDVYGGLKLRAFDRKLKLDLGYLRYSYPGTPAELDYDYGDVQAAADYDFGVATLSARVRYSPDSFGRSGASWNKRTRITVPLPFLSRSDTISLAAYGALGNMWVERYLQYGIPSQDYWYWHAGLVISTLGLDITVAYTDTNISTEGCGNTSYCSGRAVVSLSKVF